MDYGIPILVGLLMGFAIVVLGVLFMFGGWWGVVPVAIFVFILQVFIV